MSLLAVEGLRIRLPTPTIASGCRHAARTVKRRRGETSTATSVT